MKKFLSFFTILVAFLAAVPAAKAQDLAKALAPETPILYLGIDFTQVRVINDFSATASDIKNRYFNGINDVVATEVKKYEWQKALGKSSYSVDLNLVAAHNAKVDESKITSSNTADETRLKAEDIQKLVQGYDFSGKKGVGLMVVMESMSKSSENGAMWVTFINMDTKKVIHTERMVGKAMGFGFRNYYAYTVYKVIQDIKKHKLDEWRK